MPISIDATVGGSSANSFCTLVEAQAYMDGRLNESAWESATTDTKNRALVEATRELSAKMWIGSRVTSTQALSWPRSFAENPDAPWPGGMVYYSDTEIPQRVKDATAELALQFVKQGTTDLVALDPNQNVIEKTVDVLTTRWAEPYTKPQGLARFPSVTRFIRPLLAGSSTSVPIVRG